MPGHFTIRGTRYAPFIEVPLSSFNGTVAIEVSGFSTFLRSRTVVRSKYDYCISAMTKLSNLAIYLTYLVVPSMWDH